MAKNKKKIEYVDDGRVIADMSLPGMPGSMLRRKPQAVLDEKDKTEEQEPLSKSERRSIILAVVSSHLTFTLAIIVLFTLFVLFCVHIWLK